MKKLGWKIDPLVTLGYFGATFLAVKYLQGLEALAAFVLYIGIIGFSTVK